MFIRLWLLYIKNHYRLIAVDLSREKELDADSKAIQQIEFIGKLENPDSAIFVNESMFLLTILENQRNKIKIFSRKYNIIITDGKLSRSES